MIHEKCVYGLLAVFSALAFAKIYKKLRRRRAIRVLRDSKSSKLNSLVGVALGDAFGAGVEMQTSEQMAKLFDNGRAKLRFVDTRDSTYAINYWKGRYTDDAEHSLVVVRLLAESSTNVPSGERLVECFEREWLNRAYSASACTQLIANLKSVFAGRIKTQTNSASTSTTTATSSSLSTTTKTKKSVSLGALIYMSIFEGRQGNRVECSFFHTQKLIQIENRSWLNSALFST